MTLEEVIRTEIEQQYEQYRWIGRQQTLVFTFYAAIVAATFALASTFSKDSSASFFPWSVVILLFFGILGICISIALVYSRGMQVRTAIYLTELLIQITELSSSTDSPLPAIRFRQIPSSGGKFSPLDTAIIAISLAFVFGISLMGAAIALFISNQTCINHPTLAIFWLLFSGLSSVLGIFYLLRKLLKREYQKARSIHSNLRNITTWKDALRNSFKLDE